MVDRRQRENVLKVLDHVRKRPQMYISSEVPAVANFLEGFKLAYVLLNRAAEFEAIYVQVIQSRGWVQSSQAVWRQMQERGFDDEAIIAELLAIHSAVWEKIALQPDQSSVEVKPEA